MELEDELNQLLSRIERGEINSEEIKELASMIEKIEGIRSGLKFGDNEKYLVFEKPCWVVFSDYGNREQIRTTNIDEAVGFLYNIFE